MKTWTWTKIWLFVLMYISTAGAANAANPTIYTSLYGPNKTEYGRAQPDAHGNCSITNVYQSGYISHFRIFIPPGASNTISVDLLEWNSQSSIARHEKPPTSEFGQLRNSSNVSLAAYELADTFRQGDPPGQSNGRLTILDSSFASPYLSQARAGWYYVKIDSYQGSTGYFTSATINVNAEAYNNWYDHAGSNPDGSINWARDVEGVTEYLEPTAKPGMPVVTPVNNTVWTTSSQTITATSTKAESIYGTVEVVEYNSTIGDPPLDPSIPSATNYDPQSSANGTSVSINLTGNPGSITMYKYRFIGVNTNGTGVESGVYFYTIDLRPIPPGEVIVTPPTATTFKTSPSNITVASANATTIYYTTSDGSTNPGTPTTASANVSGPSNVVSLTGTAGQVTTYNMKFMGYNANGSSSISAIYTYVIDLTVPPAPTPPPTPTGDPPGSTSASPASGSWTVLSNVVTVSSSGATSILATMTKTTDGSAPAVPADPDPYNAYMSGSGSSVPFTIAGTAGKMTIINMKFRGANQYGLGSSSASCTYTFDLRGVTPTQTPGSVTVNPTSGSWTSADQTIAVSAANASQIEYAYNKTTDGTEPADPSNPSVPSVSGGNPFLPSPTSNEIRGIVSGASGNFTVPSSAGVITKIKIKFCGKNSTGYGADTQIYSYTIDLKTVSQLPAAVVVSPGDTSWKTAPQTISVSSTNAKQIIYTYTKTEDGSEPSAPTDPSTATVLAGQITGSITGTSGNFTVPSTNNKNTKIKIRFCGKNDAGYGTATATYSYGINLIKSYQYGDTISQSDAKAFSGLNITPIILTTVGGTSVLDPSAKFLKVDSTHSYSVADLVTEYLKTALKDTSIKVATSADGVMTISSSNFGGIVFTVITGSLLTTAESDYSKSTDSGNIEICTKNIKITLYPAGVDQATLKKTIESYGWTVSYGPDNVLQILIDTPDLYMMVFRPQIYADKSNKLSGTEGAGALCLFSANTSSYGTVLVTYPDGTKQNIIPFVHNSEALNALLKDYSLTCAIDSNTGKISLKDVQGSIIWNGLPEYKLYAPGQDSLNSEIQPMVTNNKVDLLLLTSQGTQVLWETK